MNKLHLIAACTLLTTLTGFNAALAVETPPPPSAPRRFELPAPTTVQMDNGMQATFVAFGTVPKVSIVFVVRAGDLDAGTQTWLPDIAGDMMKEGTSSHTAAEISEAAALMGGDIGISVGSEQTVVSIDVLSERAADAIALLAQILTQPALPESELPRIKQNYLRNLSVMRTEPQAIAGAAFDELLYPGHPFGSKIPTEKELSAYGIEDVRRYYTNNFGALRTHIYIAGRFDRLAVEASIRNNLANWKRGSAPTVNPPPVTKKLQVKLIDRPGAPQSTIRIGIPVIGPADKSFMPLSVANTVLGGSLVSRITANLREKHGWAYSPSSSVNARANDTLWSEAADVTTAATAPAIAEIFGETDRLQKEPPTTQELDAAKNYRNGLFVLSTATRDGLIGQLSFVDLLGLPPDWLTSFVDRLYAVTPAQVVEISKAQINPAQMTLVVVGDLKQIGKQIRALPQLRGARFLEQEKLPTIH